MPHGCLRRWSLRGEAEEGATTPFVVATRTDVDRRGAGHGVPPLVPKGGHQERRPKGPEDSHRHQGGTCNRVQERVQRHFVEQLVEPVRGVPVLDAPVPQMVEHLVDVLKIIDRGLPEQVIEVPKITFQDVVPHRAALHEPQLAEKLAEVPVPETVILARGKSALGLDWSQVAAPGWWQTCTGNTRSDPPQGFTASPGRYLNVGAGLRRWPLWTSL